MAAIVRNLMMQTNLIIKETWHLQANIVIVNFIAQIFKTAIKSTKGTNSMAWRLSIHFLFK